MVEIHQRFFLQKKKIDIVVWAISREIRNPEKHAIKEKVYHWKNRVKQQQRKAKNK